MNREDHIVELAVAFMVKLIPVPEIATSGAGYFNAKCKSCGQLNRLSRAGRVRCGRCKADMGNHDGRRFMMIADVATDFAYAVALHELGHLLAPGGIIPRSEFTNTYQQTGQYSSIRDIALRLEEERAAWGWARHHALYWNAEMDAAERIGLTSYDKEARRLTGKSF